jgi:hypothetical protein
MDYELEAAKKVDSLDEMGDVVVRQSGLDFCRLGGEEIVRDVEADLAFVALKNPSRDDQQAVLTRKAKLFAHMDGRYFTCL